MTDTELAWVAGLFDGEGCFTISRSAPIGTHKTRRYRATARLAITHYPTICRLKELLPVGCIGAFGMGYRKVIYQWTVRDQRAAAVAKLLLPYLVTKREQALIVIEFCSKIQNRTGRGGLTPEDLEQRESYYQQMQQALQAGTSWDNQLL